MKLITNKVKESINQRYHRYPSIVWDLACVSEKIKNMRKHVNQKCNCPIITIVEGFRTHHSNSHLLYLPIEQNNITINQQDSLYAFFIFIYSLCFVLDKLTNQQRQFLLERFSKICRAQTDAEHLVSQIRGFYSEIKTFFLLYNYGFILKSLPEMDKTLQGQSDAIFSQAEQEFQVECKSFGGQIGHPIVKKTAEIFHNQFIQNATLYNKLCPNDQDCCIEITFDKRLSSSVDSNCYSAEDLISALESGSPDIKVVQNNKIRPLTKSEYNQKLSFIKPACQQNKGVQIILHSTFLNTYNEKSLGKIKEANEKKKRNGLLIPILLSIEITSSFYDNRILLISEEIKFKNDKNELMFFQVSWNEFINQILRKHANWLIVES